MNALEIRQKRKKLGLTQKELAKLVGVSTQTINGYENGKEIPSTKHQILDKILNQKNDLDFVNEPNIEYSIETNPDKKIFQKLEKIEKYKEMQITLDENSNEFKLINELIEVLNDQIEIIKLAKEKK